MMGGPGALASPGTSFHQPGPCSLGWLVTPTLVLVQGGASKSREEPLFTERERPYVNYALRPSLWVPVSHMTPPP